MVLEQFCRPPRAVVNERTRARVSRYGIVGRRLQQQERWRRWLKHTDWFSHMPARDVRAALGNTLWDRYRRIVTIRDPFDAAVSMYFWRLRERGGQPPEDFAETRADFRAMLDSMDWETDRAITHINGEFIVTDAIRYENLATDLSHLLDEMAAGPGLSDLPQTKKTRHNRARPLQDYFDDQSIAIVLRGADWVFEQFGYPPHPGTITPTGGNGRNE